MTDIIPKSAWLVFLLLMLCMHVSAQHKLTIAVADGSSGQPVPGVVAVNDSTKAGYVSDVNGLINMEFSRPGTYIYTVRSTGFKTLHLQLLLIDTDTIINIMLSPIQEELEEVVVTSTRNNSRIEDLPMRVEVLGKDDLDEESGIRPGNITSLLGDIAGIQLQQVSAGTGNTQVRIQGLNARYTQMLRDGIPAYGGLSGNFGVLQIPPLDLRQIEIIKGSCATLYGGDAIGGILNFISKEPTDKQELSALVNFTTLGETNLNFYTSGKKKNIGYTLFGGQTLQQHRDVDGDGLTDVPDVNSVVIHPGLYWYINKKSQLSLNYIYSADYRNGGNIDYYKYDKADSNYHVANGLQRNQAYLQYSNKISATTMLSIKANGVMADQRLANMEYIINSTQNILYSEATINTVQEKNNFTAGINFKGDYTKHTFNDALNSLSGYARNTTGVFILNQHKLNQLLTLETGLRCDGLNGKQIYTLPHASFLFHFNKFLTGRLNGGYGYKLPDYYGYTDPERDLNKLKAADDPDAELSQGSNADINYHRYFENGFAITLNQSIFYTTISNPVYSYTDNKGLINLANAEKPVDSRGTQTYIRASYHHFELYLSYVYADIRKRYDAVNTLFPVTPKHSYSGTLLYEGIKNIRIGVESGYVAGQVNQLYEKVPAYFLCAFMIQYTNGHFAFVLNGENLLDIRQTKYERIYDGNLAKPDIHLLYAPVDGRVINFSVKYNL